MRLTLIIPEALMPDADHLLAYAGLAGSMGSAALQDANGQRYALVSEPRGERILDAITAMLIQETGISLPAARRAQNLLTIRDQHNSVTLDGVRIFGVLGQNGAAVAESAGLASVDPFSAADAGVDYA